MRLIPIVALSILSLAAEATGFQVEVEIPRLRVTEYHAPYVAFWIETPTHTVAAPLGLWYDDQEKWLKDLRQWWRRTGRSQSAPYDGFTGATRAPGKHTVDFSDLPTLTDLPAGDYELVVEAAREVGGREVVRIPFQWPPSAVQNLPAQGQDELHDVTLILTP